MLKPTGNVTFSIQIIDDPEKDDRPEDCGYGEFELAPGFPIPDVGDTIDHEDPSIPLGDPVLVLTRHFQFIPRLDKALKVISEMRDGREFHPASAHVTLVCRRATDDEVRRRQKM